MCSSIWKFKDTLTDVYQWYCEETDTGVLHTFHASSTDLYKRSIVSCMLHIVYVTSSNWKLFNNSINALSMKPITFSGTANTQNISDHQVNFEQNHLLVPSKSVRVTTHYTREKKSAVMPIEYRGNVRKTRKTTTRLSF